MTDLTTPTPRMDQFISAHKNNAINAYHEAVDIGFKLEKEIGAYIKSSENLQVQLSAANAKLAEKDKELEQERMRLAACGVIAMADTPDSAKAAREMHPAYRSASLSDVERRADECIELRAKLAAAEKKLADIYEAGTGHSHQCCRCAHAYSPRAGESEDCPKCGCDGVKPTEGEQG